MNAVIGKPSVTTSGILPSQRAKVLRSIGATVNVKMDALVEGSVLMLPAGACVLLRAQYDARRNGRRILLRKLESSSVHSIPYDPGAWVTTLELPSEVKMELGDIILYPGNASGGAVAAIRHHFGWMRTGAPWTPFCDVEVCLHVQERRAQFIRSALHGGVRRSKKLPLGSVVACRNLNAAEPTVWIRTDEDYWVSSTRGVTASDLMINYELDRRTYHVVWAPEGIHG